MSNEIKRFFEETGYTDITSELFGVRKDYKKKALGWAFKKPSQMLSDFIKWKKK